MKKNVCLIGLLLLLINGCSIFKAVDPLQVQYDQRKQDRPKLAHVSCECEDPEPLANKTPYPYKEEKGVVRLTNEDYDVMADNQQGRLRWQKHGRAYKRCILRCLKKYNQYLDTNQD